MGYLRIELRIKRNLSVWSAEIHHHRHHHSQQRTEANSAIPFKSLVIRERAEIIIIFLPLHTQYIYVINRLANKAKHQHKENNDVNDFASARVLIFRVFFFFSCVVLFFFVTDSFYVQIYLE